MAKLQFVRTASIYNKGLRLTVEVEFFKTYANVFILDDGFIVDSWRLNAGLRSCFRYIVEDARLRAIEKGYFKHV